MQRLIIQGGSRLNGEITVQGAKNAALPLLAGCVLINGEIRLHNCPALSDVFAACRILSVLGARCSREDGCVTVDARGAVKTFVPDELMREMRSSIVFLGAVLGRTGECRLSFPGGLRGARVDLSFPSVGATENIMLAAVLAKGDTVIYNAAREPEICDLAEFLNCCGARISGAGGGTITISGVEKLHGCEYSVMPDRIVAATFMSAAAATGGEIGLLGARAGDIRAVIPIFEQMGCQVFLYEDRIFIKAPKQLKAVRTVRTMPYPGFPTDAQAIVTAALAKAKGTSVVVENIFENRYRHVDELVRMGADIKTEGKVAVIEGVKELYGAKVRAPDLRGGAALAVAALSAEGETSLTNIKLMDRGYDCIENAFTLLGGNIKRVNY